MNCYGTVVDGDGWRLEKDDEGVEGIYSRGEFAAVSRANAVVEVSQVVKVKLSFLKVRCMAHVQLTKQCDWVLLNYIK